MEGRRPLPDRRSRYGSVASWTPRPEPGPTFDGEAEEVVPRPPGPPVEGQQHQRRRQVGPDLDASHLAPQQVGRPSGPPVWTLPASSAWACRLYATMSEDLREAARRVLPGVRADLDALIRVPSVSADPGAAAELRRSADMTAGLFRDVGTPEVEILDDVQGGQPAVLARYPEPAGDPAGWLSPPFEPTERDGRLYGRGSADDKAGIAAHLAAMRAYDGRPPVGVTVFVEGEEEIGSPTLGAFLQRHRGRLAADVIVLADGGNFDVGRPAFTTTLRGLVACVVEVRALEHAVHSGGYGGAAPDALTALCRLLASLHDERGNVAVEGLVNAETPEFDYPEERFRAEAAMLDGVQLLGSGSLAERIWAKPSASVLAIDATRVADASN